MKILLKIYIMYLLEALRSICQTDKHKLYLINDSFSLT